MLFDLTNAPGAFQRLVNIVLRKYIDKFAIIYLNDILVYLDNLANHIGHVCAVLQTFKENALYAKPDKCDFDVKEVKYLGFKVMPQGVMSDHRNIKTIQTWSAPQTVRQLRCFLGLANFYRQVIKDYSHICTHLYKLLDKGRDWDWDWTAPCNAAFQDLKLCFTSDPILRHFNHDLPTWIESS